MLYNVQFSPSIYLTKSPIYVTILFKNFNNVLTKKLNNNLLLFCDTYGVFTWRRASPLGMASPSKRAGFHLAFPWEKPALLSGLTRLVESPGLTTFIIPTKPGI